MKRVACKMVLPSSFAKAVAAASSPTRPRRAKGHAGQALDGVTSSEQNIQISVCISPTLCLVRSFVGVLLLQGHVASETAPPSAMEAAKASAD
eukprot:136409-Amphidinium_carterae.1